MSRTESKYFTPNLHLCTSPAPAAICLSRLHPKFKHIKILLILYHCFPSFGKFVHDVRINLIPSVLVQYDAVLS